MVAVGATGDANGVTAEALGAVDGPWACKVNATIVDAALNGADDAGALIPRLQAVKANIDIPTIMNDFLMGFMIYPKF